MQLARGRIADLKETLALRPRQAVRQGGIEFAE
jgi:hypothetical protein